MTDGVAVVTHADGEADQTDDVKPLGREGLQAVVFQCRGLHDMRNRINMITALIARAPYRATMFSAMSFSGLSENSLMVSKI